MWSEASNDFRLVLDGQDYATINPGGLITGDEQTLELMNAGVALEEIVATVRPPAELAAKPFLQPIYDEPEFIVRNIWRLYGGWYDGNPARLKPPTDAAIATEVAALAGGPSRLAERAVELATRLDERISPNSGCVVSELGAAIGAHTGPGMLGVVVCPAEP